MQHFKPAEFNELVALYNHEKGAKGFTSWAQFIGMLFGQISGCDSLRSIQNGLNSLRGELNHLGLPPNPVPKSTLAKANELRPAEMYEALFYRMYGRLSSQIQPDAHRKFHFKNPLRLVDSTTINLCHEMFEWAKYKANKGAVKLHMGLDGETHLPGWAFISNGKMADVKAIPLLEASTFLPKGSIAAFDRGYVDSSLFHRWTERGITFVTRPKENMAFRVVENRDVPLPVGRPQTPGTPDKPRSKVLGDQIIQFTGKQSFAKCPDNLRLVRYWDEEGKREFAYLTNNMKLSPVTIAQIYKERWAIESFFKCLKQNMIVKSFLGCTENAVKTQLWISLISLMLMMHLKFLCAKGWALSNFLAMVRLYLTAHVNLLSLIKHLNEPKKPPPMQEGEVNQLFWIEGNGFRYPGQQL